MEVKANTAVAAVVKVARKLALVTVLVFASFGAKAVTVKPSVDDVQALAMKTYTYLQNSREIGAYSGVNKADRWDVACYDDCTCISKHMTAVFNAAKYKSIRMFITPKGSGLNLHINGAPEGPAGVKPFWSFHWVTLVNVRGGWRVIDPITIPSPYVMPLRDWLNKIDTPYNERLKP